MRYIELKGYIGYIDYIQNNILWNFLGAYIVLCS